MVWTLETSRGYESAKIASLVVPYTRGQGIDIGCGSEKVWPHAIGVDNHHHQKNFGYGNTANITAEADNLSVFADESMDFVFSSHVLEHIHPKDVHTTLLEWSRVLKVGGYLILYVPSANLYPKVGEAGANPDHKWDIYPNDIEEALLHATTCGWTQVECEERGHIGSHPFQAHEYSLFEVYQKRNDGEFVKNLWQRKPEGKERCLVIRYGAIGDQIVASSILPALKKQGYHITYNTTPKSQQILELDPHIDEWLIQDTDQVPNEQLGAYWECLTERYDKIVNLCESVEGTLLTLPGRPAHNLPDKARQHLFNVNYTELTHDIAGVPYKFAPKFYPDPEEAKHALKYKESLGGPVIAWAINGSSPHKVYPFTDTVLTWILSNTDAHVFLYADTGIGMHLQQALIDKLRSNGLSTYRIHTINDKWTLRRSLTFLQVVDLVVGPETGPLNVVGHEPIPKIIYLSHSSQENLTKHWVNTTVLEPVKAMAPCFPCHKLHYDWSNCHQDEETAAAKCAASIKPERIFKQILKELDKLKKTEAA